MLLNFLKLLLDDEKVVFVGYSFGGLSLVIVMDKFFDKIFVFVFLSVFMFDIKYLLFFVLEKVLF